MSTTSIEWTSTINRDGTVIKGKTWNPLRGCSRISEGCRNCYAERQAARFSQPGAPFAGVIAGGKWNGRVELVESKLDEPLRWRKPSLVFVNSMSDLFHERVDYEWITRIFEVIERCPQHTFQILTKRAEGMRLCMMEWRRGRAPLSNCWLGVSVEDQKSADERIPYLLATPAAVRFLSVEPLLGPVSFRWAKWDDGSPHPRRAKQLPPVKRYGKIMAGYWNHLDGLRMLDWVIVGGESGPDARPCQLEWIRSIIQQCAEAGVPCYVKQIGTAWVREGWGMGHAIGETWAGKKGNNPAHWPFDLNVRQYPEVFRG